jgi:hypothetical protein
LVCCHVARGNRQHVVMRAMARDVSKRRPELPYLEAQVGQMVDPVIELLRKTNINVAAALPRTMRAIDLNMR